MIITYFTFDLYKPTTLLRRTVTETEWVDEAFVNGAWRPTPYIADWNVGRNDFVDLITDAEAKKKFPAAFA